MRSAVIYSRVSTDGQEDNHSLPTQVAACRAYAQQHGLSVIAQIEDVVSGSLLDRPGLTQVRDLLRSGAITDVIVYTMDRLTRSVAHMLLLRDEFAHHHGTLHSVTRGASADTPEDRLFSTIESSFAEFERLKIRERSVRGKKAKVEGGEVIGFAIAPYGYRYVGVRPHRALEINPDEAAIVRRVFDLYTSGVSCQKIAAILTEEKIPRARATRARSEKHMPGASDLWHRTNINAVLRNPAYRGELASKHGTIPIPAIVTPEVWAVADAKLNVGRELSSRNSKYFYLMRSRITCGCNRKFACVTTSEPSAKRTRQYYECKHKADHPDLRRRWRADVIDNEVWQWVITKVLDDEAILAGAERMHREADQRNAGLAGEAASYQKQIEEASGKIGKLVDLYVAGVLSMDDVAQQKQSYEVARTSAQRELARVNAAMHTQVDRGAIDAALRFARQIREGLASEGSTIDDTTRREVVDLLDVRADVTITPDSWLVRCTAHLLGATADLSLPTGSVATVTVSQCHSEANSCDSSGHGSADPAFLSEVCSYSKQKSGIVIETILRFAA